MNKVLVYFWLTGLFISPVFGQDFGSAVINSVPDSADVYVDGYHFGKTPFKPVMIVPGTYKLKLKHQGYDSLLTEMTVESGKRLVGKIALQAKNDSLNTDPIAEGSRDIPRRNEFVEVKVPPEIKDKSNAFYPSLAKANGVEGKVYLQLLIDLDGSIMDGVVAKSSGAFCLDYEAMKSGYSLMFNPAIGTDNKPIRVWVMYPITFSNN
ncbi:MAG: TonB family protein [Candidatus Edwardsbacteria bacterium]|nr:TonB family protein [Candidatus Edwardsbacteria bacterium]